MRGIVVNAWLALCLVFRRGLAKQTLEHTVVKWWWVGEPSLWIRCGFVALTTRWQCWDSNPCIVDEEGRWTCLTNNGDGSVGGIFHFVFMSETNKTSKKQQRGVRQEFLNKPCKVDGQSLAGSPCCFYRIYCTDTTVQTVRFILLETHVLPQDSSGTGQFRDWTGGNAAGISKQDVYWQSRAPASSHFYKIKLPESNCKIVFENGDPGCLRSFVTVV